MGDIFGVAFRPTDVELVSYYLTNKIQGRGDLVDDVIYTLNPLNLDPWEVPPLASNISARDNVWYFFKTPPAEGNGGRVNRSSPAGVWKVTGVNRRITDHLGNAIGTKKTLIFKPRPVQMDQNSPWVLYEYRSTLPGEVDYILCKLKIKGAVGGEPNIPAAN